MGPLLEARLEGYRQFKAAGSQLLPGIILNRLFASINLAPRPTRRRHKIPPVWRNILRNAKIENVIQDVVKPPRCPSLKMLFNQQHGLCCYCGNEMTLPSRATRQGNTLLTDAEKVTISTLATRDHILPKSQGHPLSYFNAAAACRLCNEQKADMPLVTYLLGKRSGNLGEIRSKWRNYKENKENTPA